MVNSVNKKFNFKCLFTRTDSRRLEEIVGKVFDESVSDFLKLVACSNGDECLVSALKDNVMKYSGNGKSNWNSPSLFNKIINVFCRIFGFGREQRVFDAIKKYYETKKCDQRTCTLLKGVGWPNYLKKDEIKKLCESQNSVDKEALDSRYKNLEEVKKLNFPKRVKDLSSCFRKKMGGDSFLKDFNDSDEVGSNRSSLGVKIHPELNNLGLDVSLSDFASQLWRNPQSDKSNTVAVLKENLEELNNQLKDVDEKLKDYYFFLSIMSKAQHAGLEVGTAILSHNLIPFMRRNSEEDLRNSKVYNFGNEVVLTKHVTFNLSSIFTTKYEELSKEVNLPSYMYTMSIKLNAQGEPVITENFGLKEEQEELLNKKAQLFSDLKSGNMEVFEELSFNEKKSYLYDLLDFIDKGCGIVDFVMVFVANLNEINITDIRVKYVIKILVDCILNKNEDKLKLVQDVALLSKSKGILPISCVLDEDCFDKAILNERINQRTRQDSNNERALLIELERGNSFVFNEEAGFLIKSAQNISSKQEKDNLADTLERLENKKLYAVLFGQGLTGALLEVDILRKQAKYKSMVGDNVITVSDSNKYSSFTDFKIEMEGVFKIERYIPLLLASVSNNGKEEKETDNYCHVTMKINEKGEVTEVFYKDPIHIDDLKKNIGDDRYRKLEEINKKSQDFLLRQSEAGDAASSTNSLLE